MPDLSQLQFNEHGLIPVIAQDYQTKKVLMMAWMNQEALERTIAGGRMVYYSRQRQRIWLKGEQSGYFQHVKRILCDCDGDVLLIEIEQIGGISCHTGRAACFFNELLDDEWQIIANVIKPPEQIYGANKP